MTMLDISQLIHRLSEHGLSANAIADATGIDSQTINSTLHNTKANLPSEEELRERTLRLTNEAISQAFQVIRYGPATQRIPLIRSLIGASSRSIGKDSASDLEDLRFAFERMIEKNRISMSSIGVPFAELNPPTE